MGRLELQLAKLLPANRASPNTPGTMAGAAPNTAPNTGLHNPAEISNQEFDTQIHGLERSSTSNPEECASAEPRFQLL
jgi:hypothetical protein